MRSEDCMEVKQEEQEGNRCSEVGQAVPERNELDKYKPTKHQKAYKFHRNFKKRCYIK